MRALRLLAICSLAAGWTAMPASRVAATTKPVLARVTVPGASLYVRVVGSGPAAIVLHGGPDFDQAYLLPDFDRLGESLRLIYYDQRGRGESAMGVRAEDVSMASEIADLDAVRRHFGQEKVTLIGHSWGTVLALEYALGHPERVVRLILMNPAPASAANVGLMREFYLRKLGASMDRQREISAGAAYQAGDPKAVTARYRIHFRPAFAREEPYQRLISTMDAGFRRQGKVGILKARAIEDRLYHDTWAVPDYDLHPKLKSLHVPTLVIGGKEDFIPVEVAERAAAAIPGAKLVLIPNCGHFSYMECPDRVSAAMDSFLP
jgi:proline iminopeptidase